MSAEQSQVITAAEVRQVEQERVSLLATFANRYGLEANKMLSTLRATVLRPSFNGAEPSIEQVAAFLIVANHHTLNPFTKEIHGFVDKRGGIVPIVGVDGWAKKINEHDQFDGMDFSYTDDSCTCTMHRKDRSHPVVVTEFLNECKRPNSEAWASHPKRMLRHRAMVQAARLAFSFAAGAYDPDEGEQILAAVNAEIDVTPAKMSPVKMREAVEALNAAVAANDGPAAQKLWAELGSEKQQSIWRELRSYERSAIKKLLDSAKAIVAAADLAPWALEALNRSSPDKLAEVWQSVQDAYNEHDQEVPLDIGTVYEDRKAELGV